MTDPLSPEQSLARGASYLDEATENLTFAEFDWAFEEVWRGVAWVLNAYLPSPRWLELGPLGRVPAAGTLAGLLARLPALAQAARVVGRLESQRDAVRRPADVERLVFEAWELHDACGTFLAVPDDRLQGQLMVEEVSPGRVGSRVMGRRGALKAIAAAASAVLPLVACNPPVRDQPTAETRQPVAATKSGPADPTQVTAATVKAIAPLGGGLWKTSDPFLFCAHHLDAYPKGNDQFGPATSLDGRQLGRDFAPNDWRMYHGRTVPGFPRHPHRGFETVTFVRTGTLDHADSMGAAARYGDGDVQWLTAGGGIQHAEMFPLLRSDAPNPLHLYQIWLNLPARDKMVDPHFAMLWNEKIPRVVVPDREGRITEMTLAAGRYREHRPPSPPPNSWATKADSDVAIWTLRMEPGAEFTLPAVQPGTKRSLYIHRGARMQVAGTNVPPDHRVQIDDHGTLALVAGTQENEMLLLQGRPIGEPVAKRGPFVMNTQQEIRQAYDDYQATQFGGWPWKRNDPVHTGTQGRFARHIDGRTEEPT
jgi:quercetin 2,3-dioxygenase